MGQSPPSDQYSLLADAGLPFLQRTADFGTLHPLPRIYCPVSTKLANPNDILFSVRAPVGELNIADREYGIGRGLCAIRCLHNLDQGFAWWTLHWARTQLAYQATGSTYEAVTSEDVSNLLIPFPNLDKQKAIANYLDHETVKIDKLISAKERLLDLLTEKRQSLITNVITCGLNPDVPMRDSGVEYIGKIPKHWDIVKLKQITEKIGSGKTPKGGSEIYLTEGIPLIRSQNVLFTGLVISELVYITEEIDAEMSSSRVQPYDVLINITGASIGRCCVVPEDISQGNVNQHVCIIRPNFKTIKSDYLNAVLASNVGQTQVFLNQEGISREGLTFEDIGNFWIPLPPQDEQEKLIQSIQKYSSQLSKLDSVTKNTIELLQERRTALITAAVTGQIKVAA
ncbi:restriction endonuclease subunit S [Anabaena aphanizomenioides LEGE 00250]|uniref:Restriction endonuclease subunit S n=1 Tax=Sphaerospermopsis aphanizomenoides LEGE 00250 TaxID=2777972 RepID=A0ABR9VEN8_9CYAN|nr:restriction endonuclease subunit S [Sphaerospermopsis aphanizomenoides]MBE9236958.1 restriction endonuclease subunit S [Sphaerospermopsis aphanizomenoides LEGE 00250]